MASGHPSLGLEFSAPFWRSCSLPPAFFTYYYVQFGHMITQRLSGQIYQNTSRVYSAPGRIYVGESLRANDLKTYLLRAGYQESSVEGRPGSSR